jgi:hypothetical protein
VLAGSANFVWDNTNSRLGIGTTTPNFTMDVKAPLAKSFLSSTTGTNTTYFATTNTGGSFYMGLDSSTGSEFGAAYAGVLYHSGAYPINFYTSGTERMRITSAGLVGIGTTTPAQLLSVWGTSDPAINVRNTTSSVDANFYCTSTAAVIGTSGAGNLLFHTGNTTRASIDTSGNFAMNSGYGSVATAYGIRAWVNFNGTGTIAIRASGNVSSLTDNGVGDYTVNYTTSLVDANYSVVSMGGRNPDGSGGERQAWNYADRYSTTSVRIQVTQTSGSAFDQPSMFVQVVR